MQENKRLKRKVRNSYIISTVSIALVLFLLGSVSYLIFSALDITDRMKKNVSVYVMLEEIDPGRRAEIERMLGVQEAVREVVFVSKDEAAAEFRSEGGGNFEEFLGFNPLPDSFEVKLSAAGPDIEKMREFERTVLAWEGIDKVVYQRGVIENIGRNINRFNLILIVFGGALLVISVILLNNTIRVSIYSKRYIISTMKLVGATRGFILRPFAGSAVAQGIWSALIACAMFVGLVYGLKQGLPEINFSGANGFVLWIMAGMVVLGILISLVFTIFAVNKFIKLPTGAVNYY
ncbi:MAG: permease-like cell division protein FtsX [Alistipes sp.]|nr:permease-like cell division protein FtsX [Alistipes sp.]